MRTFIFVQQNGSAVITLSALTYEDAFKELEELVYMPEDFRVENENGEEE